MRKILFALGLLTMGFIITSFTYNPILEESPCKEVVTGNLQCAGYMHWKCVYTPTGWTEYLHSCNCEITTGQCHIDECDGDNPDCEVLPYETTE